MSVQFSYIIRRSGHQLIRSMSPSSTNSYEHWTKEELVARVVELDDRLRAAYPNEQIPQEKTTRSSKTFNFSAHPVRKIALKFCYSGWEYNGLAYQKTPTPLPTVEQVLFQALAKTRLVDPDAGFDGCGWERCGRTDRGVSAAGQVVSLWVRSALEEEKNPVLDNNPGEEDPSENFDVSEAPSDVFMESTITNNSRAPPRPRSEFHYLRLVNRILPPTIRVIAWSPVSSDFSARFNCQKRHYKYFFSSQGLDLSLMRNGAQRLLGEHDFRNFCKLDPSKQITNYNRTILKADINPVSDVKDLYVLDLVGTAFLYHQVRHIMAILFLVGTGLEHPSIVSALLNVDPEALASPLHIHDGDPPFQPLNQKPSYQMADGLPLMLWDCSYKDEDVQWITDPDRTTGENRRGSGSELYDQMQSIHDRSVIHTALDAHFLAAVAQYHTPRLPYFPRNQSSVPLPNVIQVPLGAGTSNRNGRYIPLLSRKRMETVEVINERWRMGKGERRQDRKGGAAVDDDADE